jgi:hypothetical protein
MEAQGGGSGREKGDKPTGAETGDSSSSETTAGIQKNGGAVLSRWDA